MLRSRKQVVREPGSPQPGAYFSFSGAYSTVDTSDLGIRNARAIAIQPDRPYIMSSTSDKTETTTPSSGNPLDSGRSVPCSRQRNFARKRQNPPNPSNTPMFRAKSANFSDRS